MPIVQIEILEGRTVEQKKAMVEKVTEAIIDSLGVSAESVSIIIRDMPRTDFAKGGKLAKEW
jgi:4-oxalocrotonate tautomerase